MDTSRTTLVGAAIAIALFGQAGPAYSQASGSTTEVEEIIVTGIRGSLKYSVETKRDATAIVDAITAEDMGKFPDKNAAESLSHVPGINVDRQFGQGERLSIRGTDPALSRTLLNGQTIASADWFILDSPGRTFNYTLLAPEVVESLEVYKSPEARLDEGSIGGTVILNTRRPLNLPAGTLRTALDYSYNDRAEEGEPNYSALYSWKNEGETFGVVVTGLRSEEHISRHGIETFSYPNAIRTLPDGSPDPSGINPALIGNDSSVVFANAINSAFFEQERTRTSGTIGLQFKPSDSFELNLTGLLVKADYDNYNQSRYAFVGANLPAVTRATVTNGQITSADVGPTGQTDFDTNSRRAEVETHAIDLRADWRGDGWTAAAVIGTTEADGGTQRQSQVNFRSFGAFSTSIGKERASVDWARDQADPATTSFVTSAEAREQPTHDEEQYIQADFTRELGWGAINQLRAGVKYREHQTDQKARRALVTDAGIAGLSLRDFHGGSTPGNMLSGTSTGGDLRNWAVASRSLVENFVRGAPLVDPFTGTPVTGGRLPDDPGSSFNVEEEITSVYTQFDLNGQGFRGNIGVRYVKTDQLSSGFVANGSAFTPLTVDKDYNNWLPSLNLAFDLADDIVLRMAASRAIARANFSDLASFTSLQDSQRTGRGGNPNLDPFKASNFDVSVEWYTGNEGLIALTFFYKDLSNVIVNETRNEDVFNILTGQVETYSMTRPFNGPNGEIQGSELTYQNTLWGNFGVQVNYTYADGSLDDGRSLPFSSKHTVNLTPYYDDGKLNARITYGWRSKYFREIGRNGVAVTTDEYAQLDAAVGFRLTERIELTAQVLNLLDETHYDYAGEEDRMLAMYTNGRRFFAGVRFSL